MSGDNFSAKVKAEAQGGITGRKKCAHALAGMILTAKTFEPERIVFQSENAAVTELFVRLSEHIIGEGEASESKHTPNVYTAEISGEENITKICSETGLRLFCGKRSCGGLFDMPEKYFGSFCAGAFLSCGSVVEPTKGYHLEFVIPDGNLCSELSGMLFDRLGCDGGVSLRGRSYVLYFKESEQIEDILTLIGAPQCTMELMNVKIYRDLRNNANRRTNCDTANIEKQSRTSQKQIEAIKLIEERGGGVDRLPDELKKVALLRLENPDMNLGELSSALDPPLSRSGINHRLSRIVKIAEGLKHD